MQNFVEELRWRGMLNNITDGTEELLNNQSCKAYIGFDPTADSLGVGNLVQLMTLLMFQKCGHKPIVLMGGATGMIGDPSGKSEERNLLDVITIHKNLEAQKAQIRKILDFECGDNAALIVNNIEWFKDFGFLNFIRDVGKHLTVNYMLSKESVNKRMETGMSFTEFTYQLIQGYDFYHLNEMGINIQMGGSDQWGNITTGMELIRKINGKDAYALTTHLIKKSDGTKFGKTESGNIWLDKKKTSPYKFYQFWLNSSDEDTENFIKIFTLMEKEEIEELINEHKENPNLRNLQKVLAKDVTIRIHGIDEYETAVKTTEILFGKGTFEQLAELEENKILEVFEGLPILKLERGDFENSKDLFGLLSNDSENIVFSSKTEARKMIAGGGLSINNSKILESSKKEELVLLKDKFLVIRKGKKDYFLMEVVN